MVITVTDNLEGKLISGSEIESKDDYTHAIPQKDESED